MAILATVAGVMYLRNATPALPAISSAAAADSGRPFVVKLHARWCAVCMATKGVWSQIESAYSQQANLLVFDFTSQSTTDASRVEAKRLGLEKVFDENDGWTGAILVLDGRTKEVVASIHGSRDFAEYRAAIDPLLRPAK